MKTWKLVFGILSVVFFIVVIFQLCAAGIFNTLEGNEEVSGSAGLIVSIMMLAGGIVSIVCRNSNNNGGNIALIVMFGFAGIIGYNNYGSFSDLLFWSLWCLLIAALAVVSIVLNKKKAKETTEV